MYLKYKSSILTSVLNYLKRRSPSWRFGNRGMEHRKIYKGIGAYKEIRQ